jgi:hypothetical protein
MKYLAYFIFYSHDSILSQMRLCVSICIWKDALIAHSFFSDFLFLSLPTWIATRNCGQSVFGRTLFLLRINVFILIDHRCTGLLWSDPVTAEQFRPRTKLPYSRPVSQKMSKEPNPCKALGSVWVSAKCLPPALWVLVLHKDAKSGNLSQSPQVGIHVGTNRAPSVHMSFCSKHVLHIIRVESWRCI